MSNLTLPLEKLPLRPPPLPELAKVIADGLETNFAESSVTVSACPDLTKKPWYLAAPGICGSQTLVDVGGPPFLMPLPNKTKLYNLSDVAALVGQEEAFVLGAGAGSSRVMGVNCEMMPNVRVSADSSKVKSCSHIAKIAKDGTAVLEPCPSLECGPLANVLVCDGLPGLVLEIRAKSRTGLDNFVTCMRKAVAAKYGSQPVALAGVFLIKKGQAKIHVMPDFSPTPLTTEDDVNGWLKFFDMSAPLVCLSEFVSHDPGMDLRVEHSHCFSDHGQGGHYHYDTTPDQVEYHGLYTVCSQLVRVDRPTHTHQLGRD